MKFNFIDLFAGIGGFHQAMHYAGGDCVYASEWDRYARLSYEANYKKISPHLFEQDSNGKYLWFNCDINDVAVEYRDAEDGEKSILLRDEITGQKRVPCKCEEVPQFDVLCGGFPCQPFSIAGHRLGFEDTRGTLFFKIAEIVAAKRNDNQPPKVLFLENVKGLKNHDKGNTLRVILATLDELGYEHREEVLNAKYFGVPQNRERLFIVAWDKNQIDVDNFIFPYGVDKDGNTLFDKNEVKEKCIETHVSDIFEPLTPKMSEYYTISDKMWIGHQLRKQRNKENGKGFGYSLFSADSVYCSTISARYWKDGSEILIDQSHLKNEDGTPKNPRRLTPVEAGRLQGYNILGNGWQSHDTPTVIAEQEPFDIAVSRKEAYHQFGNSVAVPVIKRIALEIVNQLLSKSC